MPRDPRRADSWPRLVLVAILTMGMGLRLRATERRIRLFLVVLVSTYLVISLATAAIEGWNIWDGLYFGMATLTTVGYGDIHPQTTAGRALVTFLSPVGIVLVFGIGILMIQSRLQTLLTRREEMRVDPDLSGHYIVCGYGKVGQVVARTMQRMGKPLCIVERDPTKESLLLEEDIDYVIGDAMDQRSLERARVSHASTVVTTFDDDTENIYVVLEVRDIRKDVKIISTASTADAARKTLLAGAERVVSPAAIAGEMLAKSALNPDIMDFLSEVGDASGGAESVSQVAAQESTWIVGNTLADIGRRLPGVRVVMTRAGRETRIAPDGRFTVEPGMVLLVVGSPEQIERMHDADPPEE